MRLGFRELDNAEVCIAELKSVVFGANRRRDQQLVRRSQVAAYEDIKTLIKRLDKMLDANDKDSVGEEIKKYDDVHHEPEFHDYIRRLYKKMYPKLPLLSIGRHEYAIAFFPDPETRRHDVDSILTNGLSQGSDEKDDIGLPDYGKFMRKLTYKEDMPKQQDNVFVMDKLETDGRLSLTCQVATYPRGLSTTELLNLELKKNWIESRDALEKEISEENTIPERLSYRHQLHKIIDNPLFTGEKRACGIGVSTLLCFRTKKGGYRCILHLRAEEKIAESRGLYHVIPAGQFEPSDEDNPDECFSVRENVLREYVEELFSKEDQTVSTTAPYWYEKTDPYKGLCELLDPKNGGATLYLTGICINLLNLRLEICTLLLINDLSWERDWLSKSKVNFEYTDEKPSDGKKPGQRTLCKKIRLESDEELLATYEELAPTNMVGVGAAALKLGVRLARKKVNELEAASQSKNQVSMTDSGATKSDESNKEKYIQWWHPVENQPKITELTPELEERRHKLKFDFVVDEPEKLIWINAGPKKGRYRIYQDTDLMALPILWLVLTNIDKRGFNEQNIEDVAREHAIESLDDKSGHRQYVMAFRKFMGKSFAFQILPKKKVLWQPDRSSFSCCWILDQGNIKRSMLIDHRSSAGQW